MQANSCNNLNKGYCKLGQVKGDCSGRERVNSHTPPDTHTVHGARGLESTVAQGFVKHGFKVLLHPVVDGPLQASRCLVSRTPCVYTRYTRVFRPLASFTLSGFTNPVRLHPVYPCILGLWHCNSAELNILTSPKNNSGPTDLGKVLVLR